METVSIAREDHQVPSRAMKVIPMVEAIIKT
jgi:hypothetical protein